MPKRETWLLMLVILILFVGSIVWVRVCINEYNLQDDPMLWKLKKLIEPLHPEAKNLKLYKGSKSYTINKDKIYICLKDEHGEYYSMNMLIYVLIHELSHKINKDDIGHTEKFHQIFQDLVDKAHNIGIYNASIPPIENYCGH